MYNQTNSEASTVVANQTIDNSPTASIPATVARTVSQSRNTSRVRRYNEMTDLRMGI